MSVTGSATARGPEMWSDMSAQPRQRRQARHEQVLATTKHIERLDAVDAASYRLSGNGECRPLVLQTDSGVTFVIQVHERAVVDPFLLEEFEGLHRFGADEQEIDASRPLVI